MIDINDNDKDILGFQMLYRGVRAVLILSVAFVAAAPIVAQTGPATPAAPPPAISAAPTAVTSASGGSVASNDYKLGVADHVRLTVYNEPDLSGDFSVSASGTLSLPLIGDVQVLGLTSPQVSDIVQQKLAAGYLKDPRVSLEVLTYRPFYILGEVTKPGEYPYSNGLTVLNAVATAEGYTYRANKRHVFIKHAGNAEEQDLKITPGLLVQPGDTIRIGERYF